MKIGESEKRNGGITEGQRKMIEGVVAELSRRAVGGCDWNGQENPLAERYKNLQTMKISYGYEVLLEDYVRAYQSYRDNDVCGDLVAVMFYEIRRNHPELGPLDAVARILQDILEHWVMKTLLDTARLDGGRKHHLLDRKKIVWRPHPLAATKRAAQEQSDSDGGNSCFRVVSIRCQDFGDELMCTLHGKMVDCMYMLVNDEKNEVIEISSERAELERICRSLKA